MFHSLEALCFVLALFSSALPNVVTAGEVTEDGSHENGAAGGELGTGSWGLPDALTSSGAFFQYALSTRTVDGISTEYKVRKTDQSRVYGLLIIYYQPHSPVYF